MEPEIGTRVYVYVPVEGGYELQELTVEPGFGTSDNKYTWSSFLFDGNDDGVDELYVGTLNSRVDYDGAIGISLYLGAGGYVGQDNFFGLAFSDPEGLREFLGLDLSNLIHSDGGEIWRYDFTANDNQGAWTQVFGVEQSNGTLDDEDIGFRDGVVYNDKAFFSTSTSLIYNIANGGDNQAKIFYSEDGENWLPMEGGPLDEEGTRSIRALTEVTIGEGADAESALLVGTENITGGAQIWKYQEDEFGEGTWTLLKTFAEEDVSVISEIDVVQMGGKTYLGGWFNYSLFEVTSTDLLEVDLGTILDVTPVDIVGPIPEGETDPLIDQPDDNGVMQIIEYDGYLYVGSVNYFGGASLYRSSEPSDPTSWELVTTNGFRTELGSRATYTWQMSVVDDKLYITEFAGDGGARLIELEHEEGTDAPIFGYVIDPITTEPLLIGNETTYGIRKTVNVMVEYDEVSGKWIPVPEGEEGGEEALILGTADDFTSGSGQITDRFLVPGSDPIVGNLLQRDVIEGDDLANLIIGGVAGDMIFGGDEDDIILADLLIGAGRDRVFGGDGEDIVFGNAGKDFLFGQGDEDFMFGGAGPDLMFGGDGVDVLVGDFPTDGPLEPIIGPLLEQLLGMLGNVEEEAAPESQLAEMMPDLNEVLGVVGEATVDLLDSLGRLNDKIWGGGSNDIIIGGRGNDKLFGQDGHDVIYGSEGNDRIFGQNGNDIIYGDAGNDTARGGAGEDIFVTGLGDDVFIGGSDADVFLVRGGDDAVPSSWRDPDDSFFVDTGNDVIRGFQTAYDKIDLSRFFNIYEDDEGLTFEFDEDVMPALSEGPGGWTLIDISELDGNRDGIAGDEDGTGTILVRGLAYSDDPTVMQDYFIFDTNFQDGFSLLGFNI